MFDSKALVIACLAALCGAVGMQGAAASDAAADKQQPVSLIFDTDIGNDVDDAMALAMIHALASRGECRLLAITITKDNPYAARFVDLMNAFYGYQVPVGVVRQGVTPDDGKYLRRVVEAADGGRPRYRQPRVAAERPEAVSLLRQVLAAQADDSVTMVQVGFSTNLARLLATEPDQASPLAGVELVKRKVKLLSTMAGAYWPETREKKEYNIVRDLAPAQKLFAEWPTPIVASGWEIGNAIKHPAASMQHDYRYVAHHPLREAYGYYRGLENDQPTYDLTSVLYAVRPNRNYFGLSPAGRIVVEEDGRTTFEADARGLHRYMVLTPEQIAMVREAQVMLCSEPPKQPRQK